MRSPLNYSLAASKTPDLLRLCCSTQTARQGSCKDYKSSAMVDLVIVFKVPFFFLSMFHLFYTQQLFDEGSGDFTHPVKTIKEFTVLWCP